MDAQSVGGLGRLGRFGPFFAVATAESADPAWLPMSAVTTDQRLLRNRIDAVRAALADSFQLDRPDQVDFRLAVSITQLGLSARLIAVALAAALDGLDVPPVERLVFKDQLGGPFPLGVLPLGALPLGGLEHGQHWSKAMLELVRPIAAAAIGLGLSRKIAWGNLGSGVAGAVTMISTTEPTVGGRARELADEALLSTELSGTGSYQADKFRRRSCCLIYRLGDESMFCVDCVLASR